jgi:hypothetical protein
MSDYRSMHEQAARSDASQRRQWKSRDMTQCLPRRYAPFAYGIIQAAVTTGVATAIATLRITDFSVEWMRDWLAAWAIAWIAMLPVVVLAAPVIKRMVQAITIGHGTGSSA